ncbi:hypothetical protein TNCV_164181 [Trichonephila clavipes]|nr:hypothetical protein TNCV_164181 [Trichonephila clavipes]
MVTYGAVGSVVVRASNSRLEGLGLMPDATKYLPSARTVRAHQISGSESLIGGRCKNHGCKGARKYFPLLQYA